MRERAYCHGDDQFAHNCGLLNHLNSFHGRILKLNANFDAVCCSARSVILNVMATQYTCSLNASVTCTDQHHEVIIVRACALQSTLFGCQVTLTLHKPFLLN